MNIKKASHKTVAGLAMTAAVLFVSAVESAYLSAGRPAGFTVAATSDPLPMPGAKPATPAPLKKEEPRKEESIHAPVKAAPAESSTPAEASQRAADPKDPSGALIMEPPLGPGAPGKQR